MEFNKRTNKISSMKSFSHMPNFQEYYLLFCAHFTHLYIRINKRKMFHKSDMKRVYYNIFLTSTFFYIQIYSSAIFPRQKSNNKRNQNM